MRQYVINRYDVEYRLVDGGQPQPWSRTAVVDLTAHNQRVTSGTISDLPGLIAVAAGTDVDHVMLVSARSLGPDPDALAATFGVPISDLREEYAEGRLANDAHPAEEEFGEWLAHVYGPRWLAADPDSNRPLPAPDVYLDDEAHTYFQRPTPVTIAPNRAMQDYAQQLLARKTRLITQVLSGDQLAEQAAGRTLRPHPEDLDPATLSYAHIKVVARGATATESGPRTNPVLDLSTAHLPADLRDDLNGEEGVTANRRESGWLLWVPDDVDGHAADYDNEVPDVVVQIWRYARSLGCDYVLFDVDAERVSGLPVFGEDEVCAVPEDLSQRD